MPVGPEIVAGSCSFPRKTCPPSCPRRSRGTCKSTWTRRPCVSLSARISSRAGDVPLLEGLDAVDAVCRTRYQTRNAIQVIDAGVNGGAVGEDTDSVQAVTKD